MRISNATKDAQERRYLLKCVCGLDPLQLPSLGRLTILQPLPYLLSYKPSHVTLSQIMTRRLSRTMIRKRYFLFIYFLSEVR